MSFEGLQPVKDVILNGQLGSSAGKSSDLSLHIAAPIQERHKASQCFIGVKINVCNRQDKEQEQFMPAKLPE